MTTRGSLARLGASGNQGVGRANPRPKGTAADRALSGPRWSRSGVRRTSRRCGTIRPHRLEDTAVFERLFGSGEQDPAAAARIPPGQYKTDKFPVLHYGSVPHVDLATWDFKVWGEVDSPFTLTWDQFKALPRKTVHTDIHCVTRWTKLDTDWEGVPIQTILEMAAVRPSATHVVSHAEQGYTANVPLSVLDDDDVMLADTFGGEPLEPEHGYPLRLSSRSATSGRAASGSAASSSSTTTSSASGSGTATTTTPIRGRKSASASRQLRRAPPMSRRTSGEKMRSRAAQQHQLSRSSRRTRFSRRSTVVDASSSAWRRGSSTSTMPGQQVGQDGRVVGDLQVRGRASRILDVASSSSGSRVAAPRAARSRRASTASSAARRPRRPVASSSTRMSSTSAVSPSRARMSSR